MKKILLTASCLFLLIFVSACDTGATNTNTNTNNNTNNNTGTENNTRETLIDGTYTGEGIRREYGYETADVTIENGVISSIVLHRRNPDGTIVNYDEWTGVDTKPNLKQYRVDLAQQMLLAQSADVDAISGATDSSVGWMDAVTDALDEARVR